MHRLTLVPNDPTANVDHALGIQGLIRIFLPSEATAFTTVGQVTTKAGVDEALQQSKGLAGIRMTKVINPASYHLIDLLHEFIRRDWCSPFAKALNPMTYPLLRGLTRRQVDDVLAQRRTTAFHKLKAQKVKTFREFADAGLLAIQAQVHAPRYRFKSCQRVTGTFPTHQNGVVRVTMQRRAQAFWVVPLMPDLIQQVQIGSKDGALLHC